MDPENQYLLHSFVESSERKNFYDGIVMLDAKGEAVVVLPEWFEVINQDFRYQLTCIVDHAPVYIRREIHNHRFTISGGKPDMKVSWAVTGIRKDVWAQAHPMEVSVKKSNDCGRRAPAAIKHQACLYPCKGHYALKTENFFYNPFATAPCSTCPETGVQYYRIINPPGHEPAVL